MTIWLFRIAAVAALPLLGFYGVSRTAAGVLGGLAAGLALVAAELLLRGGGLKTGASPKLVDASAIIDGRIVDICETNFVSGTLLVPKLAVGELNAMSESKDPMKSARGRRGLDVLARLQELKCVNVQIADKDIPEVSGTEAKIARLAREAGAQLVTTDFNMHKQAMLEGVTVLNVNDLSTALKPVVLPGENMFIFVMKDGKEKDQGVGYLDDGTMVVVEDGRRWIGKRVETSVYSILQTSSGRMIFAKARPDARTQQDH
ncbi:MAG: PIN domain nuclease [Elusimicrobia bacterium]|nr:PIN domain nuclease [Elusimicrobiota bacterium]